MRQASGEKLRRLLRRGGSRGEVSPVSEGKAGDSQNYQGNLMSQDPTTIIKLYPNKIEIDEQHWDLVNTHLAAWGVING